MPYAETGELGTGLVALTGSGMPAPAETLGIEGDAGREVGAGVTIRGRVGGRCAGVGREVAGRCAWR